MMSFNKGSMGGGRSFPSRCLRLAVCTAFAMLMFAVSCSKGGDQAPMQKKFGAAPVRVVKAVAKDVPWELDTVGNVVAYSTLSVTSRVNGQIEKIHFKEGDVVQTGDMLVTIDPRPFKTALAQAEAVTSRDTVQMKNAKREQERNKALLKKGFISQSQYDQLEASADALVAVVAADKAEEENARLQLDYCFIRSPFPGKTGEVMINAGNYVKANDKTIVTVMQVKPIYADFSVSQNLLPLVRKYHGEGKLSVRAFPPADLPPVRGGLSFIDNAVDQTTGTIKMKAVFQNDDRTLWPGQFVKVSISLTVEKGVVVIPTQAVINTQKGTSIYVVNPDDTAVLRQVKVVREYGTDSIIEGNLKAGETVVLDGQLQVIPGGKVKVIADQPEKKDSAK